MNAFTFIYNLKFSISHITKEEEIGETKYNDVFYSTQYIQNIKTHYDNIDNLQCLFLY